MGSDRPHFQLADVIHQWRRQYRTVDGVSGTDLKEWRTPKVQDDLDAMTESFLELRGERLWPCASGFVEYPRDRA